MSSEQWIAALGIVPGMPREDLLAALGKLSAADVARYTAELRGIVTMNTRTPTSPIGQARELDEGYVSRDHLQFLSDRIAQAARDVAGGRNRLLVVSMPPRSGKSLMGSVYAPLWMLREHPDWKLGLISHDPTLATLWGRSIRNMVEQNDLGLAIAADAGAASEWQTTARGGVTSRSAPGQSITGRGFKVLLVDDIVKDFASAHSEAQRQAVWDWWVANALTRLEPPYLVVVTGCLTGETPVLMADGSERPIRDLRPGDLVATYEDGKLTGSVVNNWANQGPDDVYAIRMESGRVVRANAKHPFLTIDTEGNEVWQRTDHLQPGDRILTAPRAPWMDATGQYGAGDSAAPTTTGTGGTGGTPCTPPQLDGGSGAASSAPTTDATNPPPPRASASPTTTRLGGPQDTVVTPLPRTAERIFATGTASSPKTTTPSSLSRAESAPSAAANPHRRTPVARAYSLPTTATARAVSEGSSATTATSSSATVPPSSGYSLPLSTYALTPDRIASVALDGHEDVFDIEVDRTHNFIANGLVTHNTRWHEDDFIGRLLSKEYEGDPEDWEVISFPAIAEEADVLGRQPGEPLLSPLIRDETPDEALTRWAGVKRSVGTYSWASLFQQRPAPAQGAIFDVGWWRYWTTDEALVTDDGKTRLLDPDALLGARWLDSWDMAFKATSDSDYVVGQRWVRHGANRFLIDQRRGRWSFTQSVSQMKQFGTDGMFSNRVHQRLVEDKANGPAIIDTLRDTISGLKPINPTNSKEARARSITPEVESGNVYLPHPAQHPWVYDLLAELRGFPTAAHDDQVDALTQALSELRDPAVSTLGKPAASERRVPTNRARAAQTQIRRGPGG